MAGAIEGFGLAEVVALGEVYADFKQLVDNFFVLDEFSDGANTQGMSDLVYRFHDCPVHGIRIHILDETAIDFQKVYGQVFQIAERTKATAEIIQREAATQLFQ